mgnify:CR=1 FL=1
MPVRFDGRPLFVFCLVVSLWSAAMAGGCSSGATGSAAAKGSPATVAYEKGDYSTALTEAQNEYRKTSGTRKEAAALTAGLAAHAMGNDAEAERWLTPLVKSTDRQIKARASAALGLIKADAGDHEQAVVLLTDASRSLPGDSGARAEFYAGESYASMGRLDAARAHYRVAKAKTIDPELKRVLDERLSSGGYTVQLGAFKDEQNARRLASDSASKCAAAGASDPRVVARVRPGAPTLYTVRVGSYATRDEANRVLLRIGLPGIVTLAVGS